MDSAPVVGQRHRGRAGLEKSGPVSGNIPQPTAGPPDRHPRAKRPSISRHCPAGVANVKPPPASFGRQQLFYRNAVPQPLVQVPASVRPGSSNAWAPQCAGRLSVTPHGAAAPRWPGPRSTEQFSIVALFGFFELQALAFGFKQPLLKLDDAWAWRWMWVGEPKDSSGVGELRAATYR